MTQPRRLIKRNCTRCFRVVWTSSHSEQYLCVACRRALGLCSQGKRGGVASSLEALPKPILTVGACRCGCGRSGIELVNGLCEDSRFYGISDTDPQMSARARHSKNRGAFDYVERSRR